MALCDQLEANLTTTAVKFGGFDQVLGDCGGFPACLRYHEQVVLTTQGGGAHRAFVPLLSHRYKVSMREGIVVDFQDTAIEVWP